MSVAAEILEQIRPLVKGLKAEERLALIQSIAQMESAPSSPSVAVQSAEDEVLDAMLAEQEAWYAKPDQARVPYRGRYIALYHGDVIDHDEDRSLLLYRVRTKYKDAPIPIISGDEETMPEYVIRSPNLIQ